ncbi:hypothetical protein C8Q72DRAFT_884110 [Fomitopsis betulina]|nr:hypothetical protein C8Q72DRAFT_884110 [Fomitopsis betulina]
MLPFASYKIHGYDLDYARKELKIKLDQASVIIMHTCGVYGDKEITIARFRENYRTRLTDEIKAMEKHELTALGLLPSVAVCWVRKGIRQKVAPE